MSVRLEPAKLAHLEDPYEHPDYWDISMANGTWARLSALLTQDELNTTWNGCHDGYLYNPTQLQLIAMRCEGQDREFFAEQLIDMARDGGGATVN